MSDCLPPPGTPPAEGWTPDDKDRVAFKATWREGDRWDCDDCKGPSVRKATLCGFRFVRIATDG